MKIFCIKLLYFSKYWFFQNFDRSNLFLDWSKLRLKVWFGSVCFDRCSIAIGSIEGIFDRSNLIFDQSYREFFKTFVPHVFFTIQNFFKTPFFLSSIGQGVKANFCRFTSKILQGFSLSRPVRPYCPSFFIYFQFSCI